jgi:hypothetical protein
MATETHPTVRAVTDAAEARKADKQTAALIKAIKQLTAAILARTP